MNDNRETRDFGSKLAPKIFQYNGHCRDRISGCHDTERHWPLSTRKNCMTCSFRKSFIL